LSRLIRNGTPSTIEISCWFRQRRCAKSVGKAKYGHMNESSSCQGKQCAQCKQVFQEFKLCPTFTRNRCKQQKGSDRSFQVFLKGLMPYWIRCKSRRAIATGEFQDQGMGMGKIQARQTRQRNYHNEKRIRAGTFRRGTWTRPGPEPERFRREGPDGQEAAIVIGRSESQDK